MLQVGPDSLQSHTQQNQSQTDPDVMDPNEENVEGEHLQLHSATLE